ncbi:MAG: tetratricopeptide (TPR) repeat protein [Halioglobus sp.]
MPVNRFLVASIVVLCAVLLSGCATTVPPRVDPIDAAPVPELTLNFQEQSGDCVEQKIMDYTPLERGFTSLAAGQYIEAVQHFQRYLRLEKGDEEELEASIAIAYISILPSSPFYDTDAARKSYRKLRKRPIDRLKLHEQTLLMRQSLETFLAMERRNIELEEDNETLATNLERREVALKRLRELALGQKARR